MDSVVYGPDGEPDTTITVYDTIYQPIKVVSRSSSDLTNIAVLQTNAVQQSIKGSFVIPGYLKNTVSLSSVSINTNEASINIHPSSAGYVSQVDSLGNRYVQFSIKVNPRSDYRIQANFTSSNNSLFVPPSNIIVPDEKSVSGLVATVFPFGKASFSTDSVKVYETETGFWRTIFSPGDSSITVIPGQENWYGNTTSDINTRRAMSKIMKFSVANATFGNKLWESSIPYEAWGGGASKDGKVVAYMINQAGVEAGLNLNPAVDWIGVLDGATGTKLYGLRGVDPTMSGLEIAVSSRGQYLALGTTGSGTLSIYRNTGSNATLLWSYTADSTLDINSNIGQVRKIVFSDDDKYVYAGSGDMFLRKFDIATGKIVWKAYIGGWPFVNGIAIANGYIITGTKSRDRTLIKDADGSVVYFAPTLGFDAEVDTSFVGPVYGFGNSVTDRTTGRVLAKAGGNSVKHSILDGDFVISGDKYLEIFSRYGGNALTTRTTYIGTGSGENCQSGWSNPIGDRVVITGRDLTSSSTFPRKTVGFYRVSRSINKYPTIDSIASQSMNVGDSIRFKVVYADFADYGIKNADLKLTVESDTSGLKSIIRGDSVILYASGFVGKSAVTVTIAENSTTEKFSVNQRVPITVSCSAPSAPTVSKTSYTYCVGESPATLSATAPTGSSLNWYTSATGGTATSTTPTIATSTAGTTSYYVSSSLSGCESTSRVSISITVNEVPTKPTITGGSNICSGETVTLSSSSTSNNVWYLNGSLIKDSTRNKLVVGATGNYNLKVISNGCASSLSDTTKITVNAIPSKPQISGNSIVCSGSTVILSSNASSGNQWYLNGSAIKDSTRDKLVVSAAGSFTVKVTTNNCSSPVSDASAITLVTTPAKPTVTRDANGNLVSSASSGNQWYKDATAVSGATSASYKPADAGNYSVKVTSSGCTSSASDNYYYLSTAVFNNGNSTSLKLYPNPATSQLKVEFDRSVASKITIILYDGNGRVVLQRSNLFSGTDFNLTRLGKGVYNIKVMDEKGKLISQQKIVKE